MFVSCTWLRRALRLGGALMAAVRDLLGEGLQAEKKQRIHLFSEMQRRSYIVSFSFIYTSGGFVLGNKISKCGIKVFALC